MSDEHQNGSGGGGWREEPTQPNATAAAAAATLLDLARDIGEVARVLEQVAGVLERTPIDHLRGYLRECSRICRERVGDGGHEVARVIEAVWREL